MHLHFIGIGGIGMSALAQLCLTKGHSISGSDNTDTSSILSILKEKEISITAPQKADNIPDICDAIIYSEAISQSNPERAEGQKRGIPEYSYFEYLGEMTKNNRVIAVAGTHGKTTTTGIISAGLIHSNIDPTVIIGAQTNLFEGTNFHSGTNEWAVVEACEYRENFRFLDPEIVILTNVEVDHIDYFTSEEQYFQAYRMFIRNAKTIICHPNDPNTEKVLEGFSGQILYTENKDVELTLIGSHNQLNAQLALTLGKHLLVDQVLFRDGIARFTGTSRRQEFIGEKNGIQIYDDYGHHPTEIKATYQAFKDAFPEKTIGLIFEPHQYSRTREFLDEFIETLSDISPLGILPIYEARDTEEDKKSISTESLAKQCNGEVLNSETNIENFIKKHLQSGDVLVFMGAGNVSKTAYSIMSI